MESSPVHAGFSQNQLPLIAKVLVSIALLAAWSYYAPTQGRVQEFSIEFSKLHENRSLGPIVPSVCAFNSNN